MQRRTARVLNFTKAAIEKLEPPEVNREYHYDERTPGLALCVTSAGSKSFYLVRRIERKVEFVRLGGWPELTVENARDAAARLNGKVADGSNPAEERRAVRRASTLREAFDYFLPLPTRTKAKRPKSARTVREYKLQFEAYLLPWENRRLSQITRSEVEAWHNALGERCGHFTANRSLALLTAIYNAAIDAGYVGVNPGSRVRKFEEASRERFLQADELPTFWTALEAEPSEKARDFFKLALFTGQRRSNVLSMRWEDVSLERGQWTIPQTKTGRHSIPLTADALAVLKRRYNARGESEWVFPAHHGGGHLKDPMRAWRDICERAGIGDLRIHDLRRTLGSWQVKTGSNLPVVGRTLGHARPETTAIYGRVDADPVLTSMTTATAAILAAAKPKKTRKAKGVAGNG